MSLLSMRYQSQAFEDYEQQPFIKVLLHTPPATWDGVMLSKVQMTPIQEMLSGVVNRMDGFIMHLDGAVDLEYSVDGHYAKEPSRRGMLTLATENIPMGFRWNGPTQNFGCFLAPALRQRITAEYTNRDPAQIELLPRVNFKDPLSEQLMWALLHELESGNVGGRLYIESLAQTLLVHTLVHYSSLTQICKLPAGKGLTPAQLRCVREFIDANLPREIGVAELAASLNFSQSYFAHQFKRSLGLTPHQYLIQARVERARVLLEQGKLTVGEVAMQVGFYDQSHLTHHFKRFYHVSPKAFLKKTRITGE